MCGDLFHSVIPWPLGRGEFMECRPRLLARPSVVSVDELPMGMALPLRKRTVKVEYARTPEYVVFKEAYTPAAQDGMQHIMLSPPVTKADFCANGSIFHECHELFTSCMVKVFPFDELMAGELREYGRYMGSKYNDLTPEVVGRIDDHARAFCYKHRCAFWPISPQVLAEITLMITASLVARPSSPLRASRAYAAPRDRRERTERKAPDPKSQPCYRFNYTTCARSTDECKFGHFCMGCKAVHPVSGCQLPASVQVMARHKDPKVKEEKKTRS